jgi:hypothetical protein
MCYPLKKTALRRIVERATASPMLLVPSNGATVNLVGYRCQQGFLRSRAVYRAIFRDSVRTMSTGILVVFWI